MNNIPIIYINFNKTNSNVINNLSFIINSKKYPIFYSNEINNELEKYLSYINAINKAIELNFDKVIISSDSNFINNNSVINEKFIIINNFPFTYFIHSSIYKNFKDFLLHSFKKLINTKNINKYNFNFKVSSYLDKEQLNL
jgi:hypothetical protein